MSAGVGVGRRSVSIRSCASEVRKKGGGTGRQSTGRLAGRARTRACARERCACCARPACVRQGGATPHLQRAQQQHARRQRRQQRAQEAPTHAHRAHGRRSRLSRQACALRSGTPGGGGRAPTGRKSGCEQGWGGHAAHTRAHAASRAGPPPSALRPPRAVGHGARDTPAAITARAPQQCKCTLRGRSSPLKLCKTLIKTPFFFFTHNE